MKARKLAAVWLLGAVGALTALSTVSASDHLDGPRATADPQSDIADVFAFTSPENPANVVLAMTVTPYASDASTFSSKVDYAFRVRRVDALQPLTLDDATLDVVCDIAEGSPQTVTCTGPGGSSATAAVGDPSGGGSPQSAMRVFAGLRSDPAFFDRQGALATVTSGRASFTGANAFAGAHVLALVVEVDSRTLGGVSGADAGPVLAVAAETVRKGR